jgi:hypothetical protein
MSRPYSVGTILSDTTKTTIYTVPTGYYAKWNLCYVVNHSGNNKKIDVSWVDASETKEVFVLDKYVLAATAFVKFDGGAYVVLEEGDMIKAQAETGSIMHLINTLELVRK